MIPAEISRILRQAWQAGDIDTFAQELYVLFNNTGPLAHSGQLVLTQTNNQPALVIKNNSGDGNRIIQFQDGQGTDLGGFTISGVSKIGGPGGITIGATDQGPISVGRNDLSGVNYATTGTNPAAGGSNSGPLVIDFSKGAGAAGPGVTVAASLGTGGNLGTSGKATASSGGGGGISCQITSQKAGAVYNCTLYPNGISKPSVVGTVQQLQIDATDIIPSGTWATANLGADGTYTCQVPVWA